MNKQNRSQYDYLPDNTLFEFWEPVEKFSKTYYVRQEQENASDENDGTADKPFKTINKAASVVKAGEKVLIGSGLYQEFVQPVNSGKSPSEMISFEAEQDADVIISGAEIWDTDWVKSTGWSNRAPAEVEKSEPDENAVVWEGKLDKNCFDDVNPFAMVNMPSHPFGGCDFLFTYKPKEAPYWEYLQRRGMLMFNGAPLEQVTYYFQLSRKAGTFWVEDNGLSIHFRLPDDADPKDHIMTFTAREQLFRPATPYTSYMRIKGLKFEFVGNGFPGSQKGAISTYCGHHFVIEDNEVRWANSIGIDIGHESPLRLSDKTAGYQIVRNNKLSDIGICGICGLPGNIDKTGLKSTIVENNYLERICWHDTEYLYECAAIKLHGTNGCLVRHNIIKDNKNGSGIWMDYNIKNTRLSNNIIDGIKKTMYGAIFIEASQTVNLVDNNIVRNVGADPLGFETQCNDGGGHGIYEHDCDYLVVKNNFVSNVEGATVFLNIANPDRNVNGRMPTGRKMKVLGNILSNSGYAIVFPEEDNYSNYNVFGKDSFERHGPLRIHRLYKTYEALNLEAWQDFRKWDINGFECNINSELCIEKMQLTVKMDKCGTGKTSVIDLRKEFSISDLLDD